MSCIDVPSLERLMTQEGNRQESCLFRGTLEIHGQSLDLDKPLNLHIIAKDSYGSSLKSVPFWNLCSTHEFTFLTKAQLGGLYKKNRTTYMFFSKLL